MIVVVLGADGQVGHEVVAATRLIADVVPLVEADLDITNQDALAGKLEEVRPNVVVNAAAYTNVDGAEKDGSLPLLVNATSVGHLGRLAMDLEFGLVHFSTDFVFDGTKKEPYGEEDAPSPLSEYGRTKLMGEKALLEMDAPAVVFRTAWVYGMRCKSFVSTMLQLARTREQLRVVEDQVGNPTFCRDLGEAVALVLRGMGKWPREGLEETRGLYHLAGRGACSRYELAVAALEMDPRREEHCVKEVIAIGTQEMPLPARRPAHVDLDCSKAWEVFGVRLPPWRESLSRALVG